MEQRGKQQPEDEALLQGSRQNTASNDDAVEEDGTPVLDEQDLEENGLTEEEADNIEWDEQ